MYVHDERDVAFETQSQPTLAAISQYSGREYFAFKNNIRCNK
jgi:hypothetical protein